MTVSLPVTRGGAAREASRGGAGMREDGPTPAPPRDTGRGRTAGYDVACRIRTTLKATKPAIDSVDSVT